MNRSIEHYENFPVASRLLPRELRPAVIALYRFARHADDIADEGDAPPAQRLAELAALDRDLQRIAAGEAPMSAQVRALVPHVERHRLPIDELRKLLSAFSQDVSLHRYPSRAAVLDYCARSADPVGRLMLRLAGVDAAQPIGWSDAICSGLQILNFAQDFVIDWQKGRCYLPLDELAAHGVAAERLADLVERAFHTHHAGAELRAALRNQLDIARAMLESGRPLLGVLPFRFSLEIRFVLACALRVCDKLAAVNADVFVRRPKLSALDAPAVLWRAWAMK